MKTSLTFGQPTSKIKRILTNFRMFIDDIDFISFQELCRLLNIDNSWKILGGALNYSILRIESFGRDADPTRSLLIEYNMSGATLEMLCDKLVSCNLLAAANIINNNIIETLPINNNSYQHTPTTENTSSLSNSENRVKNRKDLPSPPPPYRTTLGRTNILPQTINDKTKSDNFKNDGKDIEFNNVHDKIKSDDFKNDAKDIEFNNENFNDSINVNLILFNDLISATYGSLYHHSKNFNPQKIIGEGGFGTIYKGYLQDSNCAIKVFDKVNPGFDSSFQFEINSLIKYNHENIIRMIGCSIDGRYKCVVYEFMPNGSLRDNLDCINNFKPLTWNSRHKIILDVTSALKFLHTTFQQPLIHGDIKSTNILIDKTMRAKLSDFGLARDATKGHLTNIYTSATCSSSNTYATKAYMPFEFFQTFRLTLATDIHCFGIVILETITGKKPYDENNLLRTIINGSQYKFADIWKDPLCCNWPNQYCQNLLDIAIDCISEKKELRPQAHYLYDLIKTIELDIESHSYDDDLCTSELAETSLSEEENIYDACSDNTEKIHFDENLDAKKNITLICSEQNSELTRHLNCNNSTIEDDSDHEEMEDILKKISSKSLEF